MVKCVIFFSHSQLLNFVTRGPVVAFELMGKDCVSEWSNLLGPTDSAIARQEAPNSIRARFGKGIDYTVLKYHQIDIRVLAVMLLKLMGYFVERIWRILNCHYQVFRSTFCY